MLFILYYLFYRHYVDDILTVFESKECAMQFFNWLNTSSNHIKFTFKQEHHGKIIFLDVELNKADGELKTKWHMKNTNKGTYLHKSAFSQTSPKTVAIRPLIFRALKISSSETIFKDAYEKSECIFILNGYH